MTKPVLCLSLLLTLTVSTVLAQDYFSLWSSQPADLRAGYLEGLLVGLKLSHTLAMLQNEPESSWDAWQRVSLRVYQEVSQVDGAAVERGISELYADPANAPIHMSLLFFPAAAKLLGVPDSDIAEALRILRHKVAQ
jgi:hypothetical protein